MSPSDSLTRRDFVKSSTLLTAGAVAAPLILPSSARGANERIQMAAIGVGGKGRHGMGIFLEHDDVEFLAVCDVYRPSAERAAELTKGSAQIYSDFREVVARSDIDAVLISTPDHWHAIPAIAAMNAGKDVYIEKPLSLTVKEGQRIVKAAERTGRVVQVGTQQRSGKHFQTAVEEVQKGSIGTVTMVDTWNFDLETPDGIGAPADCDPPAGLDWDFWQGPAPEKPYNPNRFTDGKFRWFWNYSGGKVTDWGVHLMDIVQWAMGVDAPIAVTATGGKYFLKDNRETPDTVHVTWEYPGFIATYTNRTCNQFPEYNETYGIRFYGTLGTLYLNRGMWKIVPEVQNGKPLTEAKTSEGSEQDHPHIRQFLDSVKSREPVICPPSVTHRSTSTCIIANIALKTGMRLKWNAEKERFTNSEGGNALLDYEYRGEWNAWKKA